MIRPYGCNICKALCFIKWQNQGGRYRGRAGEVIWPGLRFLRPGLLSILKGPKRAELAIGGGKLNPCPERQNSRAAN